MSHLRRLSVSSLASALGLAVSILLPACASSPPDENAEASSHDIVGGRDVSNDPELSGVSQILVMGGAGSTYCTATLISPRHVLTAAHCIETLDYLKSISFRVIGGDKSQFVKWVDVSNVVYVGPEKGGLMDFGRDIAILQLAEPLPAWAATKPIPIREAPLTSADEGRKLTVIGYGEDRPRRAAEVTLDAISGKPLHKRFARAEDLYEHIVSTQEPEVKDKKQDYLDTYDYELQTEHYEIYAGVNDTAGQVCHGDSGGPLLDKVNGEWRIVGVTSGTFAWGKKNPCILGAMYAAIGPQARTALSRAVRIDGAPVSRCNRGIANADPGKIATVTDSACDRTQVSTCKSGRQIAEERLIDCAEKAKACLPPQESPDGQAHCAP